MLPDFDSTNLIEGLFWCNLSTLPPRVFLYSLFFIVFDCSFFLETDLRIVTKLSGIDRGGYLFTFMGLSWDPPSPRDILGRFLFTFLVFSCYGMAVLFFPFFMLFLLPADFVRSVAG